VTGPGNPTAGSVAFDSRATQEVLRAACAQAGLPCDDAELLRLGENAIYRLPRLGVVVRIARTMTYWEDAKKEVAVAAWLSACDFPAARILDLPQPITVEGHPVTFWHYIEGRPGARSDIQALGQLLRQLHATPIPAGLVLPVEHILGRVRRRVEIAPVSDVDKNFLLNRFEELGQELRTLEFPLAPTPTHGDAHIKNLMVCNGIPLLIDFERFAWGQPEWDLALTATEYKTAGWWSNRDYELFTEAYGYDVMSWSGFDVLRSTHEIKMTTWLMQNVREFQEIADEYRARMRTIRDGERQHPWRPF
jgi:aminoglycoside phosphotransferase (APT) family kinase protein